MLCVGAHVCMCALKFTIALTYPQLVLMGGSIPPGDSSSLSCALSLARTHSFSLSRARALSLSRSVFLARTHSLSHTHTLSLTLSRAHSLSCAHGRALLLSRALPPSLSLPPSPSLLIFFRQHSSRAFISLSNYAIPGVRKGAQPDADHVHIISLRNAKGM